MAPNHCIQSLELDHSPIAHDEVLDMASAISLCGVSKPYVRSHLHLCKHSAQALETLQLAKCHLDDRGAAQIAQLFNMPGGSCLNHLDLRENEIGCAGTGEMLRAILCCTHVCHPPNPRIPCAGPSQGFL